jgi:ferrous iron transport protein B
MNNMKWTLFAVGYQTGFAYLTSLCVYQFGMLFITGRFGAATLVAILVAALYFFLLFRSSAKTGALKPRLRTAASR